jgi:midasin
MRRFPILLQGPTSAGKTSLVTHLAAATGHPCVRINNHDQTDLADYLGTYRSGPSGRLEFCEGPLLTAARAGSWVLLDELNLAPSDVLEALNRLLDGNRELYVPELRATVRPAPGFMLFATQNPAGGYGGRKPLSRALRTRFLELDVGDLPDGELATVVATRCGVPPSHAGRLVDALRALERSRGGALAGADVFAGRRALVTPRDLFRWAERRAPTYGDLATAGYMLLAERLREAGERAAVATVLARVMKAPPAPGPAYEAAAAAAAAQLAELLANDEGNAGDADAASPLAALHGLAWTPSLVRVAALTLAALEAAEPVLLVGDTGSGKTTAAQLAAALRRRPLIAINCSRHTEAADFVGGFRPVR